MSWAWSYNSEQQLVVSDTYHRIGTSLFLKDVINPKSIQSLHALLAANLQHIVILVDESSTADTSCLLETKAFLKGLRSPITTTEIVYSLKFEFLHANTSEIISILEPHVCILPYTFTTSETKATFLRVWSSLILSPEAAVRMKFGIHNIPSQETDLGEVQAIIEAMNQSLEKSHVADTLGLLSGPHLSILDCGNLDLPSFKLRLAEFSNARGLINYIHVPTLEINFKKPSSKSVLSLECIDQMSEQYSKPQIAVLTKILLQFGFIPILPIIEIHFIITHLSPICHPFTNRRVFFSAVNIKRFVISPEHMSEVSDISEDIESQSDFKWKRHANVVAPSRSLSSSRSSLITGV